MATVTVVFTDLVESTELSTSLGPERAEALRQKHFQQLRKAVSDLGGVEVKSVGDGIMAVFGGAEAGLDAAVAIQQAVDRHNRTGGEDVAVRVGVATGDAIEDCGDYYGESVVEAARLCALAEGGHILATDTVRTVARHGPHRFMTLGERMLKGLPDPVPVVEVAWERARATPSVPLPPRLAGPHPAAFVGRASERAVLERLLSETWTSARQVVLIAGEPGIGKTRLCSELAAAASDLGAAVLYGRCDEELGRPYQAWVEALGHLVAHCSADLLEAHVGEHGGELARLLPELGRAAVTLPPPRSSDAETERYLLWGAVTGLLSDASTEAPVVLVLDDLQWADRPTLHLLRHLVGLDRPMRVLIMATYRDTELASAHPLVELIAWLRHETAVERVRLTGLEEAEVVNLMEQLAGQRMEADGVALAVALQRETDGNPFFTEELLRHLAETAAIYRREDGRWVAAAGLDVSSLPASVREVIGYRVRRLGEHATQILGVAAVIGQNFDLNLVAAAADDDEDQVLTILERAGGAALVTEISGTPGRFGFSHALIQHALYSDLSATRRQRLHRRVAETLEKLCGDDPAERVGELARHWAAVVTPVEASKAIHYTTLAGDRALASLAPDEALRWYRQALDLLGESATADERLRCRLQVGLGEAQRQTGDPAYRETLLHASRAAQDLGETDLLVRAALANNRGWFASAGEVDAERVALVEAALNMVGDVDTPERGRLLATLAVELSFHRDHTRRKALAREAIAVAGRAQDPVALVDALCRLSTALHLPDMLEERLAQTAEAVALGRTIQDPVARFWVASRRQYPLLMRGDIDEVDCCIQECTNLAAQIRQPVLSWVAAYQQAARVLLAGDAARAERLAEEALKLGSDSGQPDAMTFYGAQLLTIRAHQGRLRELLPLLEGIAAANPRMQGWAAVLAWAHAESEDRDAAQRLVDEARPTRFDLPYDMVWLNGVTYWAQTAAEVGDPDAATVLYELLLPWHDRVVTTGLTVTGAVAHYLGRLAALLGQAQQASAHFAEALSIHEKQRAPFWIAQTKLECGRLLLDTNPGRAHELLSSARDLAAQYGCARVERLATEALLKAGRSTVHSSG